MQQRHIPLRGTRHTRPGTSVHNGAAARGEKGAGVGTNYKGSKDTPGGANDPREATNPPSGELNSYPVSLFGGPPVLDQVTSVGERVTKVAASGANTSVSE